MEEEYGIDGKVIDVSVFMLSQRYGISEGMVKYLLLRWAVNPFFYGTDTGDDEEDIHQYCTVLEYFQNHIDNNDK